MENVSSSKQETTTERSYSDDLQFNDVRRSSGQKEQRAESKIDKDPLFLKEVLDSSPEEIKEIVDLLKSDEDKSAFRYFMLTGPSSTGKTTLARAIAINLGRKYRFVSAPSLLGHHRNQTTENVHALFKEINSDPEHPVLILDEFSSLTDSHTQDSTDTADTARALGVLLDEQEENDDFLMIVTNNETKLMPHPLQKRFLNKIIEIGALDLAARKNMLQSCLRDIKNVTVSSDCNDNYLNELAQKLDNCDRRTINALINKAMLKARRQPTKQITRLLLDESFTYTQKHIQKFCDFKEHVSADERKHRETMQQNKEHFEINKRLQIDIAKYPINYQGYANYTGSTKWHPNDIFKPYLQQ